MQIPLIMMEGFVATKSSLVNAKQVPQLDATYGNKRDDEILSLLNVESKYVCGSVLLPDEIISENVLRSGVGIRTAFEDQWAPSYDFHFFNTQIILQTNKPQCRFNWINIHMTLNEGPHARYVFPETKFVDRNFHLEGHFAVSGKAGFNYANMLEGQADTGLRLEFNYRPRTAQIASGCAARNLFWRFEETKNEQLTGGLQVLAYLMRPRHCQEIFVDIQVQAQCKCRISGITVPATSHAIIKFMDSSQTP